MYAALKILFDVTSFRLRRLEMANLAGAGAIMLALRMDFLDAGVRLVFGGLLNVLAYLTNDYCDVDADLASPTKDRAKARFLRDHMRSALYLQIAIAALLAGLGLALSRGLVVALVLGAGICWVYTARLKRMPVVDVIAMLAWGASMTLVGTPLDSLLGLALVAQLGLFSACFEIIQVIRDHDEDSKAGIRTTAVILGVPRALALERIFMVLSAGYAVLVLNRWVGLALFLAPFLPFDRAQPDRYWNQVRMVQGLAWLAMAGWIWWTGSSMGFVASIPRDAVVGFLTVIR
jgi:4-hydroxybenzoate polyprenyltransferase